VGLFFMSRRSRRRVVGPNYKAEGVSERTEGFYRMRGHLLVLGRSDFPWKHPSINC
jgi:hypothetical protein